MCVCVCVCVCVCAGVCVCVCSQASRSRATLSCDSSYCFSVELIHWVVTDLGVLISVLKDIGEYA